MCDERAGPAIVLVELCHDRFPFMDCMERQIEAVRADVCDQDPLAVPLLSVHQIRPRAFCSLSGIAGILQCCIANMESGPDPMTAVLRECRASAIRAMGIDQPMRETTARARSFLTWWEWFKMGLQGLIASLLFLMFRDLRSGRFVKQYISRTSSADESRVFQVMIQERDEYMVDNIHLVRKHHVPKDGVVLPTIFVVVGMGHVPGMTDRLNRESSFTLYD